MIIRLWHGWTTKANAHAYERLLTGTVLPGIAAKGIQGYRGVELLRREAGSEVEFITLLRFESMDAVRQLAGDDVGKAYVPEPARTLLERFDERATHYELRESGQP